MLQWTGERFLPGVKGDIEIEHLHRYYAVAELVEGLDVLDLACGEGYGSSILGRRARTVVGADISVDAIRHATSAYRADDKLRFVAASAHRVPLPDASFDAIVSFETIEHLAEQEQTLAEFARLLRPSGWLCISCPDKLEYSDLPCTRNEFHVRELYLHEFEDLLNRRFRHVALYGQRIQHGSVLGPVGRSREEFFNYRLDQEGPARTAGVLRPLYFVAVASNGSCPALPIGTFEPEEPAYFAELRALNQQIADAQVSKQTLEASVRSLEAAMQVQRVSLEAEIASLEVRLRQSETALAYATAEVRQWKSRASQLEAAERTLWSSLAWRLTAPLRALRHSVRAADGGHAIRGFAMRGLRYVYRRLPTSDASKRRLKDRLFSRFPSLFGHTSAYRQWAAFREENHRLAGTGAAAHACPSELSPEVSPNAPLPLADGRWEWADYALVQARIQRGERARSAATSTPPMQVLNLTADQLSRAIDALAFAAVDRPQVSILIPAYNHLKYTVECLTSVKRARTQASFEVIVADDASHDGTAQVLAQVPNLRVLSASSNAGFLLNVNRALPYLRGSCVVLLNNDVQVTDGWLDALLAALGSAEDIGAVGPKIVYPTGVLQEAGCALQPDGSAQMVGLNEDSTLPQFNYRRSVDYVSGACLLLKTELLHELGGFDESFAPAYCEDSDLCLRLRQRGLRTIYEPTAVVIHHLSVTTTAGGMTGKLTQVARNLVRLSHKWLPALQTLTDVRLISFYLPQYHPIAENDKWWGAGFTEWRNVGKARPNYAGHDQPRVPADLGYYDLRLPQVMEEQAALARRYGIHGFCFYYYWFAGRRLLDMPLERLLSTGRPDIPFCLCWANENWTRRWDGQDREVLMAQDHSDADDEAVIKDLMRYLRHPNYIRIDGRPLLLVYRVALFPDFARTAAHWRESCRRDGVGEIYLALVESFDMVFEPIDPSSFGCDAVVEFPPHGMGEPRQLSVPLLNPAFESHVADYRDVAVRYSLRPPAGHVRFRGVMPGWDNTSRRQDHSYSFQHATPGAFQAWAEHVIEQTRRLNSGDERIVFINAWNEWAEGAYLEPDRRFGHSFLEAVKNAKDAGLLKRRGAYALG